MNRDIDSMLEPHTLFIIDDKVYDLKDWIPIHPGGSIWFGHAYGRDISTLIHTYHANPQMCLKILEKYATAIPVEQALDPWLTLPKFLIPEGFSLKRDTLAFDFTRKDTILEKTKKILATKEMKERVKQADFLFDLTGFIIFVVHLFMSFYGIYYQILPTWAFCIFFLCSRTACAAMGHYHSHRKKDCFTDWADSLFDMQYVGACIVTYEGHVLGHHTQTNAQVDPKRTVFTGLLELPRLYRVPAETFRRWATAMTGMLIRWFSLQIASGGELGIAPASKLRNVQFLFVRAIIIAEFVFAYQTGNLWVWCCQYVVVVWWNLFLIVSSHDFELEAAQASEDPKGHDWGLFQIKISGDMSVTGNAYVDSYLTGGLGCHRVHHLLPQQKSGFANNITVPIVRKIWEEMGYKWQPTRNFFYDLIPQMFKRYIMRPARGLKQTNIFIEALSPIGIGRTILFTLGGFLGMGQI